jgi:hypothetical protein
MLTVLSKTFPLGAGNTVYAGKARPTSSGGTLPSWVPSNGTVSDVGLNSIRDVDSVGVPFSYSGMAYAPALGSLGSFLYYGEGHQDGGGNGIKRYDIASRLVSVYRASAPIFLHANDYAADNVTQWMYADTTTNALQVGETAAGHMYSNMLVLPPNVIPNSPYGAIVKMGQSVFYHLGQTGGARVHYLILQDQAVCTNSWIDGIGANLPAQIGEGGTLYDSLRNRVVQMKAMNTPGSAIEWWQPGTTNNGQITLTGNTFNGYYKQGFYDSVKDLYYFLRTDVNPVNPSTNPPVLLFDVIDPVTNTAYAASSTTVPIPANYHGGGFDWDQTAQCFTHWTGFDKPMYYLKAPANPRTDQWIWSSQTITGTFRNTQFGYPLWGRARYVSALKSVFHPAGYSVPMQAIGVTLP